MPTAEATPLWRKISEHLVGSKRGISKTGTLWLPVAMILSAGAEPRTEGVWLDCLLLFAASVCRTQALILANDLSDYVEDRAAGKERWITRLGPAAGVTVIVLLLALGMAVFLATRKPAALAAYVAAGILGLLYSLKPFCFKERGLVGLVSYSAACALGYASVPCAWLGADRAVHGLLLAVVFLDRWVNLHFHQIVDFNADVNAGKHTYAARVGLDRARRTLQRAAVLASVVLASVLVFLVARQPATAWIGALAVLSAGAAALYARIGRQTGAGSPLVRELRGHYLGLTFALFRLLPPLLLAWLALVQPALWVPAALAAATSLLEANQSVNYRHD